MFGYGPDELLFQSFLLPNYIYRWRYVVNIHKGKNRMEDDVLLIEL